MSLLVTAYLLMLVSILFAIRQEGKRVWHSGAVAHKEYYFVNHKVAGIVYWHDGSPLFDAECAGGGDESSIGVWDNLASAKSDVETNCGKTCLTSQR